MGQGTAMQTFCTTIIFENSAPLSGILRIHVQRKESCRTKQRRDVHRGARNFTESSQSVKFNHLVFQGNRKTVGVCGLSAKMFYLLQMFDNSYLSRVVGLD